MHRRSPRLWQPGRKRPEDEISSLICRGTVPPLPHGARHGTSRRRPGARRLFAKAARRARLEFGAVEGYEESCREARGLAWFDELRGNLRSTLRSLRASPGFALASALSLGDRYRQPCWRGRRWSRRTFPRDGRRGWTRRLHCEGSQTAAWRTWSRCEAARLKTLWGAANSGCRRAFSPPLADSARATATHARAASS